MRCAYCHEDLAPEAARECPDCGTLVHPLCGDDLFACPTLGCANEGFGTPAPVREPGRWVAWVLFGLLGPAFAFWLDASMNVNPLIWGTRSLSRPDLAWAAPESFQLVMPAEVVWFAVLGSMLGVLLFLSGKLRASLPLLGLGVLLAAAHAVAFVPLLPLSVQGVVLAGIGLLGLCPYVTFAIYLDMFCQAQQRLRGESKLAEGALVNPRWGWVRQAAVGLTCLGVAWFHLAVPALALSPGAALLEGLDPATVRTGVCELIADSSMRDDERLATRVPESLAPLAAWADLVYVGEGYVRFSRSRDSAPPVFGGVYDYSIYVLGLGCEQPPGAHDPCAHSVELAPGVWSQYRSSADW